MENFEPNSHKYKNESKIGTKENRPTKVVSGKARTKKKSEAQKLLDVFLSEDITDVKSYVVFDVLVPAVKKAISDIVTNGVDMILYGKSGSSRNRSTASKVSYGSYYGGSRDRDSRDRYRERSRGALDYDDIIFNSRGDADAVLTAMEDIIDQYKVVSVGDLYDLADISVTDSSVNNYGWTDIHNAYVERTRSGNYMIKLPRALPIN